MFHDLFVIPNGEDEGQWMNTSDIKQRAGSAALRGGNIALSAILLPIWKAFSSFQPLWSVIFCKNDSKSGSKKPEFVTFVTKNDTRN